MFTTVYHLLISYPIYNGLILLIRLFPFFDVGVIVIIMTIIVKLILLPLAIRVSKSQIEMKTHEKALNDIKEKYKHDQEEHGRKTLEYYKEHKLNPFASIFIILIQLPIIIGLYRVFIYYGLPNINTSILYPFVTVPTHLNMMFLNLINVTQKSIVLALVAGLTTYIQISLATAGQQIDPKATDMQAQLARSMSASMKFFFPIVMTFIAYKISIVVALYLITSNVFAIAQEYYVRRKYKVSVIVE